MPPGRRGHPPRDPKPPRLNILLLLLLLLLWAWRQSAPDSYGNLQINFPHKAPKELLLPRWVLGKLVTAQSGHGDFQTYHERMGHQDAPLLYSYGSSKGLIHFYLCRTA